LVNIGPTRRHEESWVRLDFSCRNSAMSQIRGT
jgi:hypothetical protein